MSGPGGGATEKDRCWVVELHGSHQGMRVGRQRGRCDDAGEHPDEMAARHGARHPATKVRVIAQSEDSSVVLQCLGEDGGESAHVGTVVTGGLFVPDSHEACGQLSDPSRAWGQPGAGGVIRAVSRAGVPGTSRAEVTREGPRVPDAGTERVQGVNSARREADNGPGGSAEAEAGVAATTPQSPD